MSGSCEVVFPRQTEGGGSDEKALFGLYRPRSIVAFAVRRYYYAGSGRNGRLLF